MAGITPTAICNVALRRIGAKSTVSMEDGTDKEAVLCRQLFHPSRRYLLSLHEWNFAKRTAQLTADSDIISSTVSQWAFGYPLPDDYIRLLSVHPSNDPNAVCDYSLQNANHADADTVILCNSNQVFINYIFDNCDPNTFSEGFRDLLCFVLSRDLASALAKTAALRELTDKAYRRALLVAKSVDGMEEYPERMADGEWVKSRYGVYSDKSIIHS